MRLFPKYERLLENFDDEMDMCNQLGLNLDEIYEESHYTDEELDEFEFVTGSWRYREDD